MSKEPKRSALDLLVESFLNGNIQWCKKKARFRSLRILRTAFETYAGYGTHKALLAALVLKGQGDFQEYCDAPNDK